MKKVSWLVAGISLLLCIALMSCGYAKKDEVEKQLADQDMKAEQGIKLAQDAAASASEKADMALATARTEIAKAKEDAISVADQKDMDTFAKAKEGFEAGDKSVSEAAAKAAAKALADAKVAAMAEDEKVKAAAKEAADKAMKAADEADRKAVAAAKEAEIAKELPVTPVPKVFTVYFALGQTGLTGEAKAELERAAKEIKSRSSAVVKIEGHTDNAPVVRSTRYKNNWGLSQARADAVKNHLVKNLGVSAEAIKEAIGAAYYKPVASNTTSSGRKNNRRVEVTIMP